MSAMIPYDPRYEAWAASQDDGPARMNPSIAAQGERGRQVRARAAPQPAAPAGPQSSLGDAVYDDWGLVEGQDRSTFLPRTGPDGRTLAPQIVYDAASALSAPRFAAGGGNVTPEEGFNVGLNLMGGGMAGTKPVGALGMGGRSAGRSMDGYESMLNVAKTPKETKTVPRSLASLTELVGPENADIARSLMTSSKNQRLPRATVDAAVANRAALRAEADVTPGASASEAQWADWGKKHDVNMTRTPDVSLGVKDPATGKDITVPGGLEGRFTIPDVFHIKANNFDPNQLPKDVHDKLMQKFMRTYETGGTKDIADKYNALSFAQLSPNAPLTQNQFLAARLRASTPDDVRAMATTPALTGATSGMGAAKSGGMGALGTAELGNLNKLSEALVAKPEMFDIGPGETMRDVTRRTMNQVPGLGPKTASLGTPWLDLNRANTSAVDLHMIRNNWDRLLSDPEVGGAFTERMGTLLKVDPTPEAIRDYAQAHPKVAEKTAINVIGGTTKAQVYRSKKTGELIGGADPALAPHRLAYEPKTVQDFNPFYSKVVDYVDESRGPNPVLPLFPEQWRKWDGYRGRVEPHEQAHPDFRKLPKHSFDEMQKSFAEHKRVGYTSAASKQMKPSDWRKLYYGRADPSMLPYAAGAGAAGLALSDQNATPLSAAAK